MKRLLLLMALVFPQISKAADPAPILMVMEQDPWKMVIGSDSPVFVIYDDGTRIHQPAKPTKERPYDQRRISEPAKAVERLLGFDLGKETDHDLSEATDQPSTIIWTPGKRIHIYGHWRRAAPSGADQKPTLPPLIGAFLKRIDEERTKEGTPWLPEKIEVMLWGYDYAPGDSIEWPESWPDLNAEDSRKRSKDSYSVYLPHKMLPELQTLTGKLQEQGAILINGKKMAAAYRFPFPAEDRWMGK